MGDIACVPGQSGEVSSAQSCDVLVIGGGPAESTAAKLLAKAGRRMVVVLLEPIDRLSLHTGGHSWMRSPGADLA